MKRQDYTGWKDVFAFSFVQGIKDKSFRVVLIIFGLLILLGLPISTAISNNKETKLENCEVEKVYVYDESNLGFDFSKLLSGNRYEKVQIVTTPDKAFDATVKEMEDAEHCNYVLLKVSYAPESAQFQLQMVKAAKTDVSKDDFSALGSDLISGFEEVRKTALEVTEDQAAFINQAVVNKVMRATVTEDGKLDLDEKDDREGVSMEEYFILLGGIMLVMMLVNMSGGQIANAIVTEKTTRVVEYLMINVKPMALIVGKILACLLQTVIQFIFMGICYGISSVVTGVLFGNPSGESVSQESAASVLMSAYDLLGKMNPLDMIILIVVIIVGIAFFAIVAGLAGASVSKLEELAEGMKIYQICLISGTYIGIGLCIAEMIGVNSMVVNGLCLIPIAAPFVIPSNILLGKISTGVALISTLLLLVITILLFSFTAKVYESMIFYNGKVLKLKDIIAIAKNRRGNGKGEK